MQQIRNNESIQQDYRQCRTPSPWYLSSDPGPRISQPSLCSYEHQIFFVVPWLFLQLRIEVVKPTLATLLASPLVGDFLADVGPLRKPLRTKFAVNVQFIGVSV
jgi:hypothetical protein